MNALSSEVQAGFRDAAFEAAQRADVRSVVIYGGSRVFAAGADVKELASWTHQDAIAQAPALMRNFTAVAEIPKPTIAAITGYALGGGLELALCADFRVAAENAKLGLPEILLGVIPGAGGTQRLARLVGPSKAKELIFSGKFISAAEALEIGLVDRVVPAADVLESATQWAGQFVNGPAMALRAAKLAIDAGFDKDLSSALDIESRLFSELFATADRETGMTSFVENGPGKATFEGR